MNKENACIHICTQWNTIQPYKKKEVWPFVATWMDLEGILVNKSDRERQILYITYMWIHIKNTTN